MWSALAILVCLSSASHALADEPPPGMIEVPTTPQPATATSPTPKARVKREPIGPIVFGGFSCLSVSRTVEGNGSCFALVRVGVEFGWAELHLGGLFARGSGYNPFTGLDEGDGPAQGLHVGAEAGSPFMPLSRRVRLAARGAIDHDFFWSSDGRFVVYATTFTNNVTIAVALAHDFAFIARAGIGFAVPFNLVVDGGVGIRFSR